MDIGNQIKALRLRRGVTQEAMAQHFGITAQAVSKWETGSSVPDIGMLPALSAYFGVSIDELFALSDEIRMERIQNMLWDARFLNPADVDNERHFLLEMGRRETDNADPYCMLAQMELHLAQEHSLRAEEYALEAVSRSCCDPCNRYLARAMGGKRVEPRFNTHNRLIAHYKALVARHPQESSAYAYLIAQLIDDHRLSEAKHYCALMAQNCSGYYVTVHRIKVALACHDLEAARAMWEQMGREHPENWEVRLWIGDFQAQTGDYAAAKARYREAIDLEPFPRYVDPIDSLAQVCEMDGDLEGAIAARKLELEVSEKEWRCTSGESVDFIRRELARLEALLRQAKEGTRNGNIG